jgi:ferrous iron transport protein B
VSKLSHALGVPIVPVDGRTAWGVEDLISELRRVVAAPESQKSFLADIPDDPVTAYAIIGEMLDRSGAIKKSAALNLAQNSVTARIDRVVLHRYFGFPVFFAILGGLFASIFWAAEPFGNAVEWGFAQAGGLALTLLPEGVLARFVAEGLIGGLGSVAVFFPQIIILFLLMTLLEDSGYLSRGAALIDKPLSHLGLHGRSFVPMLSGYACAIPAVLAARTIPSKVERRLTIWILPLMSCGARLPVYGLLLTALLPGDTFKAGLALAIIYVASMLAAAVTAGLISRFVLRSKSTSMLAMELPLYRKPLLKPTLKITWSRSSAYLKRAGLPIIIISAVIWLLSNFGLGSNQPPTPDGQPPTAVTPSELDNSFAAQMGRTIEPALAPMGVDWRAGVGLVSAFLAREVFVSALVSVYHVSGDEEAQQEGLLHSMREATFEGSTRRIFTTSSIIGLIVFFFFSLQCLSTVSVVRAETGSWRFALLQLLFYTGLGYLLSSVTVQGLRLFGVD